MAWWDYGYQITGIGNRTSLADGNTWNHEHIALLGKCLVIPEHESHKITRHLADYVLVDLPPLSLPPLLPRVLFLLRLLGNIRGLRCHRLLAVALPKQRGL